MSEQKNDMQALADRAGAMVDTLTGAIMGAVEVAAEKLALACDVARVSQRLAAFGSVLEAVGVQKAALAERLETATGAARELYRQQIKMLEAQEVAVLKRVGVPDAIAEQVPALVEVKPDCPTHRRDRSRFVPVNGTKN